LRLIVTHEQPDFDALASLALARLLFPGSTATIQGGLSRQLNAFLRLYRDELDLTPVERIDLQDVDELVVVDTNDPSRIRPFDSLLGHVPVTLYDHHPQMAGSIAAARGISERLGSTATLLTRELMATAVTIPPPVATLALLGIHEDTGNLTFDQTSADDYRAAAHLLASGANLQVVRRFAHTALDAAQSAFRDALLAHTEVRFVAHRPVAAAAFEHPTYVAGVSGTVNDLLDLFAADAAIVAVKMGGRTLVFARSNERFDCAAALASSIGGAGHPGAAYGKSNDPPPVVLERVLDALALHAAPTLVAEDLMSTPVRTVRHDTSVAEATDKLLLFGHNGMPVLDDSGQVIGVVSRRDLDRANRHGLANSRVSGFMTRDVISAPKTATLPELEALVLDHNIGRIPIVDHGRLVGIVTRTDLIGARHRETTGADVAGGLLARLPSRVKRILDEAAAVASGRALYLVGGTVRDLMLGAGVKDVDLVIEGESAESFGTRLQARLGGTLSCHVDFGTCTLALEGGAMLDLATAREETYARPGVLPAVTPSSLRKDLGRRDFSVNALALRLRPQPHQLIDPFGGAADLAARQLRVLHPLSFVEDPTRILRGARLAGRLGFHFERGTLSQARAALDPRFLGNVSRSRLRAELEITLDEPRVAPALSVLCELHGLEAMFGLPRAEGRLDPLKLTAALDALREAGPVPTEAYLLALFVGVPVADLEKHVEEFNWPRRHLATLARLHKALDPGLRPTHEGRPEPLRDEDLEALEPAARLLLRVIDPELGLRVERIESGTPRRRLRGSDVVGLGVLPGPRVGRVLDEVARARAEHEVATFEEELDLARRLVKAQGNAGGLE
jgi:tRNA nucleotidyltransferase (CCA-adding enzyme)